MNYEDYKFLMNQLVNRGSYQIPNVWPAYISVAAPAQTVKQKCEASGGTWTVYAFDPGIRQEACIPPIKPGLCQLAAAAGYASVVDTNLCGQGKRGRAKAISCAISAMVVALSCNDGDLVNELF